MKEKKLFFGQTNKKGKAFSTFHRKNHPILFVCLYDGESVGSAKWEAANEIAYFCLSLRIVLNWTQLRSNSQCPSEKNSEFAKYGRLWTS